MSVAATPVATSSVSENALQSLAVLTSETRYEGTPGGPLHQSCPTPPGEKGGAAGERTLTLSWSSAPFPVMGGESESKSCREIWRLIAAAARILFRAKEPRFIDLRRLLNFRDDDIVDLRPDLDVFAFGRADSMVLPWDAPT